MENYFQGRRTNGRLSFFFCFLGLLTFVSCGRSSEIITIDQKKCFTNSVGMQMIAFTSGLYVSKYETTEGQYLELVGRNPSSMPSADLTAPVETVSFIEAFSYAVQLTKKERLLGKIRKDYAYCLPSYSEWLEYVGDANLSGSITPIQFSGKLFHGKQSIGSGEKNRFGVFDLRGNVSELSRSAFRKSTRSVVVLGGEYDEFRESHLSIYYKRGIPSISSKGMTTGFRLVLVPVKDLLKDDSLLLVKEEDTISKAVDFLIGKNNLE